MEEVLDGLRQDTVPNLLVGEPAGTRETRGFRTWVPLAISTPRTNEHTHTRLLGSVDIGDSVAFRETLSCKPDGRLMIPG